jgi:hypothetical protein
MKSTAWLTSLVLGGLLVVAACTPLPLLPGAEDVLTVSRAPRNCERLGTVAAHQGGLLSGDLTSNEDLDQGARNELRNKAHHLGADTVQITSREGSSGETFAGSDEPREVRYEGIAWRCGATSATR